VSSRPDSGDAFNTNMTAQILSNELTAIFQESKKKHPELRIV
jgi:hypothetical protein